LQRSDPPPEETLLSDPGTNWRINLVRGYLLVSFALVLLSILMAPFTPGSVLVLLGAMPPVAAIYLALYMFLARRPQHAATIGLYLMFQTGILLDLAQILGPPMQHSSIAMLVILPAATAFLSDRRHVPVVGVFVGLCLFLWALFAEHLPGSEPWQDAVGLMVGATILGALAWLSERQREQWQARSEAQRQELSVAVEAAQAAAHARSTFLATMSHEIRTPLNGVLGLTRLLSESELPPDAANLARTALSSGRLLQGVLDDILDLAKLESDRLELDPRPLSPRAVVEEVLGLMQANAHERGVGLRAVFEADTPEWLRGDDTRIRQILINLVGNAIKFTEQGEVVVRVCSPDGGLRVQVEDTGIGIDPDKIDTLFQPFVQAEASTTRRFGGTGLGLAICARLCERMEGRIGAAPRDRGGSIFWFELPLPTSPPPSLLQRQRASLAGLRILVAEDNPVNRVVIRRTLEGMDAQVRLVEDGVAALEAVREESPDVLLLDCYMPVMDGFTAARTLRVLTDSADLPIIAVTASVTVEDRERILEAGMDGMAAKPIDPIALASTVQQVLERRRRDGRLPARSAS